MEVTIFPSLIHGVIFAPSSKSAMQRACAAALVAQKPCRITYYGALSKDDQAAIDIIKNMGAAVSWSAPFLEVNAQAAKPISAQIHCGESGLSIRMFTPLIALQSEAMTITGKGSLTQRPMDFFDTVLPLLNVTIQSKAGKLPLTIQGPLKVQDITIDGSLSSQFLTGLLLAYAAAPIEATVTITVIDLKSKPYIDLTLQIMHRFGLPIPVNNNYASFVFSKSTYLFENNADSVVEYTVEGDWSGGAFLLVAGAIAAEQPILIKGLDINSQQADKAILQALQAAGVHLVFELAGIRVGKTNLQAFHFDATDCPDLFPPLVALAAYSSGKTSIKGVKRLFHKESNRGLTLQKEFGKMGVAIELLGDTMWIEGGGKLKGARVSSHNDHRIAMATAVAALCATGATTITEANAIGKSYINFYKDLAKLGVGIDMPPIEEN